MALLDIEPRYHDRAFAAALEGGIESQRIGGEVEEHRSGEHLAARGLHVRSDSDRARLAHQGARYRGGHLLGDYRSGLVGQAEIRTARLDLHRLRALTRQRDLQVRVPGDLVSRGQAHPGPRDPRDLTEIDARGVHLETPSCGPQSAGNLHPASGQRQVRDVYPPGTAVGREMPRYRSREAPG